jgi:hypothetical protein
VVDEVDIDEILDLAFAEAISRREKTAIARLIAHSLKTREHGRTVARA